MKSMNPKSIEIALPLFFALLSQLVTWVCVFWALLKASEVTP